MTRLAQTEPAPERTADGARSAEVHRVRQAASPDTAPELLRTMAADPSVTVRAAVALNPAAPAEADHVLAGDANDQVRTLLAGRLAALLPGLQTAERDRLQHHALTVLARLVDDEAVRVRAAIADVVKDMDEAPHGLILRLAYDSAMPVSEPVIRLSPLLTTSDLLELLAAAPDSAPAIATRDGLHETVCDAVAATANAVAIEALLANRSAAIREATLDLLVAHGAEHPGWHPHLIRRPCLSVAAARALSDYVAGHLLAELADRADLPVGVAVELKRRLALRLQPDIAAVPPPAPNMDEAMRQARALATFNRLNETTLLGAVQRGEVRMATALLAVAAGVPAAAVDRAATLRSAKAVVSLVWRAGFSMQVAGPLQTLLARTPPVAVLRGGPGGAFPLATDEMRWQIDFLMRTGR